MARRERATETAAFVCSHVFANVRPVLYVSRADGEWQFLCGDPHPGEVPKVMGIGHLLERDQRLCELSDLAPDWEAERAATGAPWKRRPVSAE